MKTTITITIDRTPWGEPGVLVDAYVVDAGGMRYHAPQVVVPGREPQQAAAGTMAGVAASVSRFAPSVLRAVEDALGCDLEYPHQATTAGACT